LCGEDQAGDYNEGAQNKQQRTFHRELRLRLSFHRHDSGVMLNAETIQRHSAPIF
jgi:hypothetical protein